MTKLDGAFFQPATWWLVGTGCAVAAGISRNPIFLSILVVALLALLATFTSDRGKTLRFYLAISGFVILVRILFRIIFNYASVDGASGDTFSLLPTISLNLGLLGTVNLFGAVSAQAVGAALIDGLRMGAILLSIGVSNSLANPKKLLKKTPAAFYEVAAALSMAVNLAPQMLASAQRVRRAARLRGRSKGLGAMVSWVIPTLEDTLDRSLALSASMDARGFGRASAQTKRLLSRSCSIASILLLSAGTYLLLTAQESGLALALIAGAVALAIITVSGSKRLRTNYRKEQWRVQDYLAIVVPAALVASGLMGWLR
jgi:energy-coupling factor transport system permease protein